MGEMTSTTETFERILEDARETLTTVRETYTELEATEAVPQWVIQSMGDLDRELEELDQQLEVTSADVELAEETTQRVAVLDAILEAFRERQRAVAEADVEWITCTLSGVASSVEENGLADEIEPSVEELERQASMLQRLIDNGRYAQVLRNERFSPKTMDTAVRNLDRAFGEHVSASTRAQAHLEIVDELLDEINNLLSQLGQENDDRTAYAEDLQGIKSQVSEIEQRLENEEEVDPDQTTRVVLDKCVAAHHLISRSVADQRVANELAETVRELGLDLECDVDAAAARGDPDMLLDAIGNEVRSEVEQSTGKRIVMLLAEHDGSVVRTADATDYEVEDDILRVVTEECRRQINAGNYDAAASLADIYDEFVDHHCADDSAFTTKVLESDTLIVDTMEFGRETIAKAIFQRLIEALVDDGQLLYVYNRQQVRSHVAEMTRYFALMRQRLTADTNYEFTPNLVKMVKLASADREQPIMGRDRDEATRFRTPIRRILDQVRADGTDPAWELADTAGSDWEQIVRETMDTMSEFFDDGLPDEFDSLAAYQARAFTQLYLDAVTDQSGEKSRSHVVTASTGGGKTEAFIFPTLAYCLTAAKANIDGNKAVLTYPRTDLCDNQFERAFDYITELNRIEGSLDADFEDAPLTISIQHSSRGDVTLPCPHCDGTMEVISEYDPIDPYFRCDRDDDHKIEYATVDRSAAADIIVTTQNSLHRRMMDKYGRMALWESPYPPKFMVLDEVHIYTDQAGMNVANVVRRFKQALRERARQQSPTLVASSATINNAEDFTRRIFDTETADRICPADDEKDTTGREHFVFVKATDPRDVVVPVGDSVYRPREEWEDVSPTTATNLSCMIQVAFGFFHTMRKERAGSRPGLDANKDRVLGFVDSIDSVSRLGGYVQEAEENGLFKYRFPDAILGERGNNPDCPRDLFRGATDDEYDEDAVCESLPPNKNINPCPVYQDGECWWTMRDRELDLEEMTVAIHRSGNTKLAGSDQPVGDDWDQLITTSALEVGFDHASIIGTFQYRAPRNVPGFLQRKGRGGRDAEDEPITVVVLGSTPTDSYYFHHSNYLSDPRDEHLRIPLDEDNRFIRAEHMTAAILDYFNVSDDLDAERAFRGTKTYGPDIDYLRREFLSKNPELREWLAETFDAEEGELKRVLSEFHDYLDSANEAIAPGIDDRSYWKFFSDMLRKDSQDAFDEVDRLVQELEGER